MAVISLPWVNYHFNTSRNVDLCRSLWVFCASSFLIRSFEKLKYFIVSYSSLLFRQTCLILLCSRNMTPNRQRSILCQICAHNKRKFRQNKLQFASTQCPSIFRSNEEDLCVRGNCFLFRNVTVNARKL